MFACSVRWILGGIFCLSAIAKGAAIAPFTLTVQRLTDAPAGISGPLAWALVVGEGALGVALLSGRWRSRTMPAASLLLAAFGILLMSFLVRGERILCNCFGPAGPKLPLKAHILLDITLASLGILAAWRQQSRPGPGLHRRGTARIAGTVCVWLSCAAVVAALPESRPPTARGQFSPLADMVGRPEGPTDISSVFFLVDFSDFGCVLCLDDFLAMADSVDRLTRQGKIRTRLISRSHSEKSPELHRRTLKGWMEGNRYGFDAQVDDDSLFERTLCTRTTLVVLDEKKNVMFSGTFPLGPARREEVLQALKREK